MATKKLTDGLVKEAVEAGREAYIWDTVTPRFGLRITPAGKPILFVQYSPKVERGGKRITRREKIGEFGKGGEHGKGPLNVTKARARADEILAEVRLSRDPFAEKRAALAAQAASERATAALALLEAAKARDTFEAVSARYIASLRGRPASVAETARLLRHEPPAEWAARHIGDIKRAEVREVLNGLSPRAPAVARNTWAAFQGLFRWCLGQELIDVSPCQNLTPPPRPKPRDRVLSDDELQLIWQASDGLGYPFGAVVKLLMLTGQRRGEVGGMARAELDMGRAVWRIPAERAKNGQAHEVDLSAEAVAIIAAIPDYGPLLFPPRKAPARGGDKQVVKPQGLAGFSATKRRLDGLIEELRAASEPERLAEVPPWRLHDLRRTAATGMAALGYPPHIVERVLNHVSGTQGGLVGVYQRHEYRAERKAALAAWGARVAAVVAA